MFLQQQKISQNYVKVHVFHEINCSAWDWVFFSIFTSYLKAKFKKWDCILFLMLKNLRYSQVFLDFLCTFRMWEWEFMPPSPVQLKANIIKACIFITLPETLLVVLYDDHLGYPLWAPWWKNKRLCSFFFFFSPWHKKACQIECLLLCY